MAETQKVLVILPKSIGGRLTTSSIKDGFILNGYEVKVYDELYDLKPELSGYSYIAGYDFSPIKFKIDNNLNIPTIAYFSDIIYSPASESYYKEYYKYIHNQDIFVFYWDRELSKKENVVYFPHFVNCEIYKNYKNPTIDVSFMGRFDTDIRLETYLYLNKSLPDLTFRWYAIQRHFDDACKRCKTKEEKSILEKTYFGFIDNERDMADKINDTKIIYNINAQGKTSLNYRTIQTMSCERLLISDYREELDLFNNILPVYKDKDDLVKKIRYYLASGAEYNSIVKKSREYILKNHEAKKCVKRILDYCHIER